MKTKPFFQIHSKTCIPLIDEIRFHLIITNDVKRSHEEFKLVYSPGTCVHQGGEAHMDDGAMDCYIFICRKYVMHDMIGHELHHALHQIMERIGHNADQENDEMTARIAGFLSGWTYRQLEKMGVPVTHKPQKV